MNYVRRAFVLCYQCLQSFNEVHFKHVHLNGLGCSSNLLVK